MTTPQPMTNSHILVNTFDYYEPETVAAAVALLAQHDGRAKVLAGGTDLLVQMKIERIAPQAVISLNHIPALDRMETDGTSLHIGARTTIRAIEQSPRVQADYRALAEACANFSSTQVQTMGTIGGNLGNASPAADSAPSLLAFGATLVLAGPQGERKLALADFFIGPGKSALQVGEIITGVELPQPKPGTGSAFAKVSRVTNDIAKANCAALLVRGAEDRILDCRLAFGSVAPTPIRSHRAESLLIGQVWSEALADVAASAAAAEVTPIDDVRSTAAYRREVVRVMVSDGLRLAWERAGAEQGCSGAEEARGHGNTVSTLSGAGVGDPAQSKDAATRQDRFVPFDSAQGAPPSILRQAAPTQDAPRLGANDKRLIELKVNGRVQRVWVSPYDLLLNVLRNDLELTGTKYGCGIGECSACTVLMDGKPVLSCLVLAVEAAGHDIVTIEGLAAPDGTLDPLQEAFIDYGAYQCGYCTPGQILTAKSLLNENAHPTEDDVRRHLRGNMCRCTGYAAIVRAVLAAAGANDE
jgi:carbon-monoxide dehydrogenase medium subunit